MTQISTKNGQQDIKIAQLEIKVDNLNNKLETFISNDFVHLRRLVLWLIGLSITSILIPIFFKLNF